ncbi:MAG: hypothetical protein HYW50_00945 [Candidatus Diapherotrites archaeon]|nr:hypothetical protein [Candidatus Diapherotrites archaeon]
MFLARAPAVLLLFGIVMTALPALGLGVYGAVLTVLQVPVRALNALLVLFGTVILNQTALVPADTGALQAITAPVVQLLALGALALLAVLQIFLPALLQLLAVVLVVIGALIIVIQVLHLLVHVPAARQVIVGIMFAKAVKQAQAARQIVEVAQAVQPVLLQIIGTVIRIPPALALAQNGVVLTALPALQLAPLVILHRFGTVVRSLPALVLEEIGARQAEAVVALQAIVAQVLAQFVQVAPLIIVIRSQLALVLALTGACLAEGVAIALLQLALFVLLRVLGIVMILQAVLVQAVIGALQVAVELQLAGAVVLFAQPAVTLI